MKATSSAIFGLFIAVLLLLIVLKVRAKGGVLPPHEFAFGTALKNVQAIPQRMDQFLSLEVMNANETKIQTYIGNSSGNGLKPLITYISSQKNNDFGPLIAELNKVDQLSDQKQKAIELVKSLLPYKDLLRDKSRQDALIVFVFYGMKQPSGLSQTDRANVSALVKQLDTAQQSAEFDSGECARNYLVGNINIYPLALENTSWHDTVEFASPKDAPVLEIRFMGLKGIFRYMLDEMTAKTGEPFVHLDGESLR